MHYTHKMIKFCAEECNRQHSGELSVADMVNGYGYAYLIRHVSCKPSFCHDDVLRLGEWVEPIKNKNGFRTVPVSFGVGNVVRATNIPNRIGNLLKFQDEVSPEAFYQEFETIHPFVDGNGRVGAILFNALNGTMDDPITPPEFKS